MKAIRLSSWEFAHGANSFEIKAALGGRKEEEMNQVIQERVAALKKVMEQAGVDYYMVPTADFHNSEYVDRYFKMREYLSGFTGSNGTLMVSSREAGLWTDGRYFIQAENELAGTGIKLFRMLDEGVPTIQEYLQENMKEGQTLGFDGRVVDTAFGRRLEKALQEKKIRFAFGRDLGDQVWTDRPALPCHPVTVLDEAICGKTAGEKLEDVRSKMEELGADAFLLSKLDDLMWASEYPGSGCGLQSGGAFVCLSDEEGLFLVHPGG